MKLSQIFTKSVVHGRPPRLCGGDCPPDAGAQCRYDSDCRGAPAGRVGHRPRYRPRPGRSGRFCPGERGILARRWVGRPDLRVLRPRSARSCGAGGTRPPPARPHSGRAAAGRSGSSAARYTAGTVPEVRIGDRYGGPALPRRTCQRPALPVSSNRSSRFGEPALPDACRVVTVKDAVAMAVRTKIGLGFSKRVTLP